jgi:hypothetical protein
MNSTRLVRRLVVVALGLLAVPVLLTGATIRFGSPVKVTPDLGFGYEPAVVADPAGNIFVTAHKENWQLVAAPDANSPTYTRSMSWVWMSVNDGASFRDIPGLTNLGLEQHEFGDEGDLALDDAGHLYFVDTYVGDNTLTRWTIAGRDHAPKSPYVYVVCGNDGGSDDVFSDTNPKGTLWAYVSSNDGHTFERYRIASYKALDATNSWPTVSVAPDGTVWALYVDAAALDADNNPIANSLMLFRSRDHGQTWAAQNITPLKGRYEYGWLAVSADGKQLGLGVYYKPGAADAWRTYGAIWNPGAKPALISLDENNPVTPAGASEAPGDLMGSFFGPDGKLSVVWTRRVLSVPGVTTVMRDIYYARSQ